MPYRLYDQCHSCVKAPSCSDRNILMGAITAINSNEMSQGHKGSGSIHVECTKYVAEEARANDKRSTRHKRKTEV